MRAELGTLIPRGQASKQRLALYSSNRNLQPAIGWMLAFQPQLQKIVCQRVCESRLRLAAEGNGS